MSQPEPHQRQSISTIATHPRAGLQCSVPCDDAGDRPCDRYTTHILLDSQGVVLWVSAASSGLPQAELVGRPLPELVVQSDANAARQAIRSTAIDGVAVAFLARDRFTLLPWFFRASLVNLPQCNVRISLEMQRFCPLVLRLSRRQREILYYLSWRPSVDEVSQRLGLSASTIRTHLARAKKVLGRDLTAAILWANGQRHVLRIANLSRLARRMAY